MNIRRTVFTPYPVFARMLMHFYLTYRCDVRGCERRINLVKSAGGSRDRRAMKTHICVAMRVHSAVYRNAGQQRKV